MPNALLHQSASGGRRSTVTLFSLVAFAFVLLFGTTASLGGSRTLVKRATIARSRYAGGNPFLPPKARATATGDKYLIGVGKADITGPVVEINFAGYASLPQIGTGLRQRVYARSFIIGEVDNPENRFVYVVLDAQSGDTAVRYGIMDGLAALGANYSVYGAHNVAVTGTHAHSGPGAWFNYLLPQVTSLGFDTQSYQAIATGALLSIQRAHDSLAEGYLDFGTTNITDGNLSRSLWAYLGNPEEERARYNVSAEDDGSVEKTMTLLRFQRASDGKNMGVLSWYPVHGTSMLENNTIVTGDNKGVAAYLFEQAVQAEDDAADGFVAGFSQANVGDTTPNTLGAWCDDGSGEMCTLENSTCAGVSETCHGRGPLFYKLDLGMSSCYEIGTRQFQGAKSIYDNLDTTSTPVVGPTVRSFHTFNDMRYYTFALDNGTQVQTCPAALGFSFAAGTTDGPGMFDFTQADSGQPDDPLWDAVRDLLTTPSAAQTACQYPKPVLLDVGEMDEPYAWSPNIVDVQSLRVGQLFIIISPSEATTMSGRRWKEAVVQAATEQGLTGSVAPYAVLGGPANSYAHYLATPEEYQRQRYEGASTLFGQWELPAYINLTLSNLQYLSSATTAQPAPGPSPPDNRNNSLSFISPVVMDNAPAGAGFGDCTAQPAASYAVGSVVNATFVGANPRNNLRLEGTFAAVEQLGSDGATWTQVLSDQDWRLVYYWTRTNTPLGYSDVVISWETNSTLDTAGTYRLHYYGDYKPLFGSVTAFDGASNSFTLTA